MSNNLTAILLVAAVVCDAYLEIKKIPVPSIVVLLAGFCVRHIIGDNPEPPKPPEVKTP